MAQNAETFEDYLKQQDIVLERNVHGENTLYVINEDIDLVGPVSLMALFNDSDRFVTLISYKYLQYPSEKRSAVLELVNTLNTEYTIVKFMESGAAVSAQVVVPVHDNFSPQLIIEMISLVFQAMREEHKRFMEVLA